MKPNTETQYRAILRQISYEATELISALDDDEIELDEIIEDRTQAIKDLCDDLLTNCFG